MQATLQLVISGLLLGGIYALAAMGLNLIFGVAKVVNFAHGEFLMLGMYAAYGFSVYFGINPYWGAVLVFVLGALVGVVFYLGLIRFTIYKTELTQVFATLGVAILLQNLALMAFSADYLTVQVFSAGNDSIPFMGAYISTTRLMSFLFAMAAMALVMLFLKKTYIGKAIEAVSQDLTAARLVGINVHKVLIVAFAIGIGLTALAGCVLVPSFYAFPTVGSSFVLISFVVVVLGGLGNVPGTVAGGLLLGVIETIAGYIEPDLKEATYFVLLILLLAFLPSGMFGIKGAEKEGLK
ncbi:branched-chain amino acid ABC transporter permease [Pusillimonas sp. TS35]|uniref:branched-chain amino acid ABC transporter permease n=1 Tax=Paracandidimonas lactea TaxID=2895524 RepID=UPI0013721005|nr:branched-chain amino acid ABC transporter permease [Paracandidimonas lactea]MYN13922.1 branched-chain amino acid ABC transporter permease [Pusillimonas sp. TS35]